jgi:hypothetical protein
MITVVSRLAKKGLVRQRLLCNYAPLGGSTLSGKHRNNIHKDIVSIERIKEFDDDFIKLARAVYYTNDIRAKIKKEINLKYSSGFVEEKSYQSY